MASIADGWLDRQAHLKPSSRRPLEIALRLHVLPAWGQAQVAGIRQTAIRTWIADLGGRYSATTVIRCHGILAGLLDDAVSDRFIAVNPARGVKLPRKARKPHVYLDHRQLWALADAAGQKKALVLVLGYSGLRWGEAVALRVRDLDLLRRRLTVNENAVRVGATIVVGTPKSHKARSVPLPRALLELLARQCEGKTRDDLLFPSGAGGHQQQSNSTRGWWHQAVAGSGVPRVTPHDLRHTAASLAVSAGANVKAVQRILGHASAAMTLDVYADLFSDDLDAVADRLDAAIGNAGQGGVETLRRRALDPRCHTVPTRNVGTVWARAPMKGR